MSPLVFAKFLEQPAIPTPEQWMGGLLVGLCISFMLYGVVVMQTYLYIYNSQKDGRLLRAGVWIVLLAETLHTAFLIHMAYVYAIQGFVAVTVIPWSSGAVLFMEMAVLAVAHCYYLRRTWVFSKGSWLMMGFLITLLIVRCASGLFNGIVMYTTQTWAEYRDRRFIFITVTCGNALAVLLEISVTIITILQFRRFKSGMKRSEGVIRWIVVYTVHSCALTTVVSLLFLFTYLFVHHSLLYIGFYAVRSKLYANAFLGLLNTRELRSEMLRSGNNVELGSSFYLSTPQANTQSSFRPVETIKGSGTLESETRVVADFPRSS